MTVDTGANVCVVRSLDDYVTTERAECDVQLHGIADARASRAANIHLRFGAELIKLYTLELAELPVDLISANALLEKLPNGRLTYTRDALLLDNGNEHARFERSADGLVRLSIAADNTIIPYAREWHASTRHASAHASPSACAHPSHNFAHSSRSFSRSCLITNS